MRIYYSRLSKEEKNNVKKEFLKKGDSAVYLKAKKIITLCIIGIVFAIGSGIFDIYNNASVINYALDGFLFCFSVFVMIRMFVIQRRVLNNFALAQRKK